MSESGKDVAVAEGRDRQSVAFSRLQVSTTCVLMSQQRQPAGGSSLGVGLSRLMDNF